MQVRMIWLSPCHLVTVPAEDYNCIIYAGLIVGVGFKPTTNDAAQAGAKSGIIKKPPPPPPTSSTSSKTNKENISSKKSEQAQQQQAPVTVSRSHQQTTPYQNSPAAVPTHQQQQINLPSVVAVESSQSSHYQTNSAKTDKNNLPQVESAQDRKKSDSRQATLSTSKLQTAVKHNKTRKLVYLFIFKEIRPVVKSLDNLTWPGV